MRNKEDPPTVLEYTKFAFVSTLLVVGSCSAVAINFLALVAQRHLTIPDILLLGLGDLAVMIEWKRFSDWRRTPRDR